MNLAIYDDKGWHEFIWRRRSAGNSYCQQRRCIKTESFAWRVIVRNHTDSPFWMRRFETGSFYIDRNLNHRLFGWHFCETYNCAREWQDSEEKPEGRKKRHEMEWAIHSLPPGKGAAFNVQLLQNFPIGVISCTEDYAVFADTLACGGISREGIRILKPETIEQMKQNLLSETAMGDIERTMGRKGYGYGCGVQVLLQPELIGSKAPVGVFGWDGAAGSCIIMDTKSKSSLVYIQHVRNCGIAYSEFHPRLRELLFEEQE